MSKAKNGAVALAAAFLIGPTVLSTQSMPTVQQATSATVKRLADLTASPAKAYTIDKTYALGAGEGSSVKAINRFIIMHYVGVPSGAADNASFFKNNWSTSQTYTQYVVGDWGKVYQSGEPGYVAWGAGEYANNNSPVQIELGYASTYEQFKADYAAYVKLAHDMAVKFGIPLQFNQVEGGIVTHKFISDNFWGNHQDPVDYLNSQGVSQSVFAHDVVTGTSSLDSNSNVVSNPAKPQHGVITTAPNPGPSTGLTAENWHFTNGNKEIQARYSPSLSGEKAGNLPPNCTVYYDGYINRDGYCWVHYKSYSNDDIYLPVHPTGSANNLWGEF